MAEAQPSRLTRTVPEMEQASTRPGASAAAATDQIVLSAPGTPPEGRQERPPSAETAMPPRVPGRPSPKPQ